MTQYAGSDTFPSDFTIPDDSAPPTASNLLVSIEALGDRTTWLKNRTGSHRVVARAATEVPDNSDTGAVVVLGGNNAAWSSFSYTNNAATLPLATYSGLEINDEIEFEISGFTETDNVNGIGYTKVLAFESAAGTFSVQGAKVATPEGWSGPTSIAGRYVVTHSGTVSLGLDGKVAHTASTFEWLGAFSFKSRVWRANT